MGAHRHHDRVFTAMGDLSPRCSRSMALRATRYHDWCRHALGFFFGLVGISLAMYVLLFAVASQRKQIIVCAAGLLSTWCALVSLRDLTSGRAVVSSLSPRHLRARAATLLLTRALLCGLSVAMLGCTAAARSSGELPTADLLLMAAMQASATVGAWGACAMQHEERPKSPPPHDDEEQGGEEEEDEDERGSTGGHCGSYASPPSSQRRKSRRGSATLPRGWRYHAREGLFEHKRSGRVQREPPSTGVTGSPLHADLPPCDEEMERGLLDCEMIRSVSGGGYSPQPCDDEGAHESVSYGASSHRRHSRSSTWTHRACPVGGLAAEPSLHAGRREGATSGGRQRRHSSEGRGAPMSIWELRDALATAPPDSAC